MSNETNQNHAQMVKALFKDGQEIVDRMTKQDADIIHAAVGISGEAGELLDAIKKHVIYKKPLDVKNVTEELGDIEFYLEALRQNLNITREETLSANVEKLAVRYPGFNYSDENAITRADKA